MTTKRHALAARREIVGHTQETLAEVVGVEPTTVGRWERGETCPQPWCRPKLAEGLTVSVEELDSMLTEGQPTKVMLTVDAADQAGNDRDHDPVLSAPWNHRGTVESAIVLRGGGYPVKRRGFVLLTGLALTAPAHQWLIHEPGPLVSGLSGRRVSGDLADRLPPMIAELRALDDVAGGGTVLSLTEQQFGWVAGLLDEASYDEPTGWKLHGALAELGQLAGWAAYDAGRQALAQRYYIAGLRAAHTAGDRPLGAHILSCMAEQAALEGRPAEAVTLIQTAFAGVRGRETPRLLSELYIRQGYALGIMQDAPGCTAAVSKARSYVQSQGDEPPWLYWVSPADITAFAGNCLLQLSHTERAASLLEEGVDLFDESFIRDRQIYSIHLADSLAQPGKQRDLDAAASRGIEAVQLAESLDSNRGIGVLRNLYHQMKPHAKVPAVGDFLDQARGLLSTGSPM